jgi:hypothetical protein
MEVDGQRNAPVALPLRDAVSNGPDATWASGPFWKGTENLALTGVRIPDGQASSDSLYRLHKKKKKNKGGKTKIRCLC